MSKTILFSITIPVVGMVLVLGLIFQDRFETALQQNVERLLQEKTELFLPKFSNGLTTSDPAKVQAEVERIGKASSTRITLVLPDGKVLADSNGSPEDMENHLLRPEVQQALKDGVGRSRRFSQSVNQEMIYFAQPISSEKELTGFVRLSLPTGQIKNQLAAIRRILALALLISLLVSLGIATWLSRHIAKPIESITWGAKAIPKGRIPENLHLDRSDVLGKLSRAIHKTGKILREQVAEAESEKAKLNAMLKAMTEGVLAVNKENRILFCNPAAQALFGISLEKPEEKFLQDVVPTSDIEKYIQKARQTSRSVHEECSFKRSGETIRVIAHVRTFGTEHEEGVVLVLHDVTQRRKLEQVRKDFVENASHELRTPLTAIKGYAESLVEEGDLSPEKRNRFLHKILQNVNRLTALTGDLMKLARIESNERIDADQTIECKSTLLDLLDHHKEPAHWKDISLTAHMPDHPISIQGEPLAFTEIVDNLVSNAIKYTHAKGAVDVTLLRENGHVVLRVKDTGIGIPKSDQERVFERFYRVDKARSLEQGGTGLGLSIVKHRVSQLKGRIALDSEEGMGTTFTVQIPVKGT